MGFARESHKAALALQGLACRTFVLELKTSKLIIMIIFSNNIFSLLAHITRSCSLYEAKGGVLPGGCLNTPMHRNERNKREYCTYMYYGRERKKNMVLSVHTYLIGNEHKCPYNRIKRALKSSRFLVVYTYQ